MRKVVGPHVARIGAAVEASPGDPIDVASVATVLVTSEAPAHPVELLFDGAGGPGGTRWEAGDDGDQTIVVEFDVPRSVSAVLVEIAETRRARVQELELAVSTDRGASFRSLLRQEFVFSPPSTCFERELWRLDGGPITHLKLWIRPDKSGTPLRATATTLALFASGS